MMTFLSKTSTTVVSQGSPLIAPDNGEAPLSPFVDSTAAKHRKRLRSVDCGVVAFIVLKPSKILYHRVLE